MRLVRLIGSSYEPSGALPGLLYVFGRKEDADTAGELVAEVILVLCNGFDLVA